MMMLIGIVRPDREPRGESSARTIERIEPARLTHARKRGPIGPMPIPSTSTLNLSSSLFVQRGRGREKERERAVILRYIQLKNGHDS